MVSIIQSRLYSTHQSISIGDVCLDDLFDSLILKGCKHQKHKIMFANGLSQVLVHLRSCANTVSGTANIFSATLYEINVLSPRNNTRSLSKVSKMGGG